MSNSLVIAVDFDGTCVTHEFPQVGRSIGAEPILKELVEAGHKLVLWTIREGDYLAAAEQWFADAGIPLFGVNKNPDQTNSSPKVYASIYIDDLALGCPLIPGKEGEMSFVDWAAVRKILFPDR